MKLRPTVSNVFIIFGGVELTARHIPFIPKQLDTSRAKVFTFSSDAPLGPNVTYTSHQALSEDVTAAFLTIIPY
jgi:hypothetical protein